MLFLRTTTTGTASATTFSQTTTVISNTPQHEIITKCLPRASVNSNSAYCVSKFGCVTGVKHGSLAAAVGLTTISNMHEAVEQILCLKQNPSNIFDLIYNDVTSVSDFKLRVNNLALTVTLPDHVLVYVDKGVLDFTKRPAKLFWGLRKISGNNMQMVKQALFAHNVIIYSLLTKFKTVQYVFSECNTEIWQRNWNDIYLVLAATGAVVRCDDKQMTVQGFQIFVLLPGCELYQQCEQFLILRFSGISQAADATTQRLIYLVFQNDWTQQVTEFNEQLYEIHNAMFDYFQWATYNNLFIRIRGKVRRTNLRLHSLNDQSMTNQEVFLISNKPFQHFNCQVGQDTSVPMNTVAFSSRFRGTAHPDSIVSTTLLDQRIPRGTLAYVAPKRTKRLVGALILTGVITGTLAVGASLGLGHAIAESRLYSAIDDLREDINADLHDILQRINSNDARLQKQTNHLADKLTRQIVNLEIVRTDLLALRQFVRTFAAQQDQINQRISRQLFLQTEIQMAINMDIYNRLERLEEQAGDKYSSVKNALILQEVLDQLGPWDIQDGLATFTFKQGCVTCERIQGLRNRSLLFWNNLRKIQSNVSWPQLTQGWINISLPNLTNLQVNVEAMTLRSDITLGGSANFWVNVAEGIKGFGKKIGDLFGISWEIVIICVCVFVFLILLCIVVRSKRE